MDDCSQGWWCRVAKWEKEVEKEELEQEALRISLQNKHKLKPRDLLDYSISDTVASCLEKTHMEKQAKKKKEKKPKKKKNQQTKIKRYFATVKPSKNFQGFNKKECTYKPSIQDYVYIPHGYGYRYKKKEYAENPPDFCHFCNLAPCIMKEHHDDISQMGWRLRFDQEEDDDALRRLLTNYIRSIMEGYFGKRYMQKLKMPLCVPKELKDRYPLSDSAEDADSEDSDDSAEEDSANIAVGK